MGLATAKVLGVDHRIRLLEHRRSPAFMRLSKNSARLASMQRRVCDITQGDSVAEALFTSHKRVDTAVLAPSSTRPASARRWALQKPVASINGSGTVNIARAFLPRTSQGDVLVNVASTAAYSVPNT